MPRSLGYADAVRLLGGRDSTVVTALEKSAGWLMLGATLDRKAYFQCGVLDDMVHHAFEQISPRSSMAVDYFARARREGLRRTGCPRLVILKS